MEAKDTKIIIGLTIEEVEERKRKNLVNYDIKGDQYGN